MKLSIEFDYITGTVVLQTPHGYKTFEATDGPLLAELKRWDRHSRLREEEELAKASDGTCQGCKRGGSVVPLGGAHWHLSCWHNAKLAKPKEITKVPEGRRQTIFVHPDGTTGRVVKEKKTGLLTLEDLGEL